MPRYTCILLVMLALAAGCDEDQSSTEEQTAEATAEDAVEAPDEAPPESAEEAPDEAAGEQSALAAMMRGHFAAAVEARGALIRADFESARASMGQLAEFGDASALPENLRPSLEQMQASARSFSEAEEIPAAGQALANTLVQCGACHEHVESGPTFAVPPVPEGDTLQAHMQRHRWAADRMWEGLVKPDLETFRSGAEILGDHALFEDLGEGEPEALERAARIASYVHELGEQAAEAQDTAAQAEVFGRFIASCAACHRELGRGPGAQPAIEP